MLELIQHQANTVSQSVDRSINQGTASNNGLKASTIKTTPHQLAAIISKIKGNNQNPNQAVNQSVGAGGIT